jgi:hypothetical protein
MKIQKNGLVADTISPTERLTEADEETKGYVLRIRRPYRTTKGQRRRASESKVLRHVRPEKKNVSSEWRKISNAKVIGHRRARRVGRVARKVKIRNAHILVAQAEAKWPFGESRRRCVKSINIHLCMEARWKKKMAQNGVKLRVS